MARASAKARHPGIEQALRMQYAALCWRDEGELEILLITSRETRRWLIPKGWPMRSLGRIEPTSPLHRYAVPLPRKRGRKR
jgi:hypothetical protein